MSQDGTRIGGEQDLRDRYPEISPLAALKTLSALDIHCRNFIARSPFLCLGTAHAEGKADVSPRGDAPGFVTILDDRTLAIPDRPGNNRLDSMANILSNPEIGLIFLIPGMDETLRVNGQARIVEDPALLSRMEVQGKRPKTAIVVEIREVFLHCGKALKRSRLWDPESRMPRGEMPGLGRMIADQTRAVDPESADQRVEESDRTRLY
jgi:PPOX class probable FMN-dependent enzyme